MKRFQKFLKDEEGLVAIEYALIAAGVALAIIVVVKTLGSNISTKFQSISDALKT